MLRSLRVRLVLLCVGLAAAGLAVCSGSIYLVVTRELVAHFDGVLTAQAHTIAALVEFDARRGTYEFKGGELLVAEGQALRVAVRSLDGTVLAASHGSITDDPEPLGTTRPRAWWWTADGERWRGMACSARTMQDDEEPSDSSPEVLITVARRSTALDERIRHIALLLTSMTIGLSLVLGGALGLVIGRALRPLDQLTARLARWGGGTISERLPVPDHPTELIPVVTTLNQLLTRIEASVQRERAAGSAIAHEVRTPLAGLQAVIEVALSKVRSAEANRASLAECLAMVTILQHLVESLLLLTRLEQGQVPLRPQPLDLGEAARARWEPFTERAAQRGLHVTWTATGPCPLTTDPDLLAIVLRNLLDNAVDHADRDGVVAIHTAIHAGHASLTIGNSCSSLTTADLERIFNRFWRGDQARAVDDHHCGLGLCLAQDLTHALGGQLTATLRDGRFSVTVTLPGAHAPLTPHPLEAPPPANLRHQEHP